MAETNLSKEAAVTYQELRGDTPEITCNKEAGSYSHLWGRNCWVGDSMLKLIQCSIDEEMNRHDPNDPLWKVYQYCEQLREKNRIGDFADVIG